jgi:hypothetical protein
VITVKGEICRHEFKSGDRLIYGDLGVAMESCRDARSNYFGDLMNIEFVGTTEQVCHSRGAVQWREPVTVTISTEGERVELATVECLAPIDLGTPSQAGVVLSGVLGPGKWRVVAERAGK